MLGLPQIVGTATAWYLLFHLNEFLFGSFDWAKVFISWVFLPAAARLLSVMLFGWRGALGLWLGTLLTNEGSYGGGLSPMSLTVATLSATGPLIAVQLTMHGHRVPMNLRGLTAGQLTVFAVVGALCNVVPHNVFFWLAGMTSSPVGGVVPMFVGDLLGTVLVLYALRFALVTLERFVRFPTP
mgnify:CR=1 FL=1